MINIDKLLESKRVEVSFEEISIDSTYVKQFRHNNNLTQAALANVLGVTKKAVEKWEQGVNKVNGSSAVLLKLLNDNPELIKQLYKVNVVSGKKDADEYSPIDHKVITGTVHSSYKVMKSVVAAVF